MKNSVAKAHLADVGLPDLPNDWDVVEIQNLLSSNRGISVGVMYPGEHDPEGIPLVKVGDLTTNIINSCPAFRITPEKHYEYRRTEFEGGEILITLVGALGHCVIVPESMKGWNAARAIAVLRLKNPEDAEFIRICLLSPPLNQLMNVWANTSVQPTINLKEIKKLPIPFPKSEERKKIVQVVSSLDRAISNLRKQNETLEKIAQTLFKHWFVDFEFPNEGGKPYKSSGGAMVRSDLGEIPVSWRVGKLESFCKIKHGHAFKGEFITTEETTQILLTPGNFRIGGGFNSSKYKYYLNNDYDEEYILTSGDLIITMTDLSKEGDTLGYPAFVPKDSKSLFLHNQRIGKITDSKIDLFFLFLLLCRREYRSHILGSASGSTVRHTSPSRILDYKFAVPSEKLLKAFSSICSSLLDKSFFNHEQIQTLTKTRDRLLPELMSGKLRITE